VGLESCPRDRLKKAVDEDDDADLGPDRNRALCRLRKTGSEGDVAEKQRPAAGLIHEARLLAGR